MPAPGWAWPCGFSRPLGYLYPTAFFARFLRPDGRPLSDAPPLPAVADDALAALAESLIEAGVDLEGMPGYPEWDGSALDLGWAVDGLRPVGTTAF